MISDIRIDIATLLLATHMLACRGGGDLSEIVNQSCNNIPALHLRVYFSKRKNLQYFYTAVQQECFCGSNSHQSYQHIDLRDIERSYLHVKLCCIMLNIPNCQVSQH